MNETIRIWNPVEAEWLLNVPSRARVPARADLSAEERSVCPFCPGAPDVPSDFESVVVESRFPVVGTDVHHQAGDAYGRHRVLIYTPRHGERLANMALPQVTGVVRTLALESDAMFSDSRIRAVYVFEVFGDHFGPTVDHAHTQVVGLPFRPRRLVDPHPCVMCDVDPASIVWTGDEVSSYVPLHARYPFEVWIQPSRHVGRLGELTAGEQSQMAEALRDIFIRFRSSHGELPPHVWGVVQAPTDTPGTHLRIEVLPLHSINGRLKRPGGLEVGLGLYTNPLSQADAVAELRLQV